MTYEAFKRELYQNVLKQAGTGGRLAKLLEKGEVCQEDQLARAVRIMNLNAQREGTKQAAACTLEGAENVLQEDVLFVILEGIGNASILHWKVRPLYERYKKEGWQSVLPEIVMKLRKSPCRSSFLPFDENSYENSAEKLMIRPLNYPGNREELENCISWRFGDIALALYGVIYDMDPDFMTMKITRGMLEKWNVSGTEALTNALLNTYVKMPPRLYEGTDFYNRRDTKTGVFMKEEGAFFEIDAGDCEKGLRGYRLTTNKWLNGAVALFYPGVKERLAELFQGDYYVGFTSIHEAVIHPVQHKVLGEMKAAIQHSNAVFDKREMLTNSVYRYSSARRELLEV